MKPIRSAVRLALLPLLATLLFAAVAGAEVAADESFIDIIDVEVVNVEVVVTDGDGNPITDLGREDFAVYEDGEPVEITNFYAVDRVPSDRVAADGEAVATEEIPGGATRQLHLAVLVDQESLEPQNRAQLFAALRQDLDRAFALDGQVMVAALDDGLDIVVPFTDDREQVLTALDELARVAEAEGLDIEERLLISSIDRARTPPSLLPKDGGERRSQDQDDDGSFSVEASVVVKDSDFEGAVDNAHNLGSSIRAYAEREVAVVRRRLAATAGLVDALSGLPGRKAVLFLGEGVSRRPADFLADVWRAKFDRWLDANAHGLTSVQMMETDRILGLVGKQDFDTSSYISDLLKLAAERRVAFYPVLVTGRSSLQGTSNLTAARSLEYAATSDQQDSMIELAEGTGGIAWTTPRNLDELLDRLAQDFAQFYSLGYEPPRPEADDYRRIQVKVERPGVKVRHVAGYRVRDPAKRLRDLTLSALHFGAGEDNPLGVSLVAGDAEPDEGKRSLVTVLVRIPFDKVLLVPQGERYTARLRLIAIVRDQATGGTSRPHEVYLPVAFPRYMLTEALNTSAGYPLRLSLRQGEKQIAVGLRDELSGVDSTTRIDVLVPEGGGERRVRSLGR